MAEGRQSIYPAQDDADIVPPRLTIALAWVSARQARDRALDSSLFVNPAWDILLDLYICYARGRPECVTDVCVASTAPPTTVLRWITILEDRGLIARSSDPRDRRRTLVELSPHGLIKMEEALDASIESDHRLGLGRVRLVE